MVCLITLSPAVHAAPGDVKWTFTDGKDLTDLALAPDGTIYLASHAPVVINQVTQLPTGPITTVTYYPPTNHLYALGADGVKKWDKPGIGQHLAVTTEGNVAASYSAVNTDGIRIPSGYYFPPGLNLTNLVGIQSEGNVWFPPINGGRVALSADNSIVAINHSNDKNPPSTNSITRLGSSGWVSQSLDYLSDHPVIGPDGTVYAISWAIRERSTPSGNFTPTTYSSNKLFALSSDGRHIRTLAEDKCIYSVPVVGNEGQVFFGSRQASFPTPNTVSYEETFRCMTADLKNELWRKTGPSRFGIPAIGAGNSIYVGCGNNLFALDKNGSERWIHTAPGEFKFSPAIASDGTIYAVTDDTLWALNSENGAVLWSYQTEVQIALAPTVASDGTVYIFNDSKLIALEGTAPPANAPWPQDRHDAQRTSRATQASTSAPSKNVDGKFSLTLNLEPGRVYKVEASEDLQTWTEINSFTSSSAAQTFLDETSAGKPQRFYRLVLP